MKNSVSVHVNSDNIDSICTIPARLVPRQPCKIAFDFVLKNEHDAFLLGHSLYEAEGDIPLCQLVNTYNPYISRFATMTSVITECYQLLEQHREVMKLLNHHHLKKGIFLSF